MLNQPVVQAYAATDPAVWGVDRQNYCCRGFALGCPPAALPTNKAFIVTQAVSAKTAPVAKCRDGTVPAVYRCTANNFQVLDAVRPGQSVLHMDQASPVLW